MTARAVNPSDYADLIWSWYDDFPNVLKRAMGRENDGRDELLASFAGDLNYLICDGATPVMFVNCAEKLPSVFDTHLFCPRRIKKDTLFAGMAAGIRILFTRSDASMMVFDFLSMQRVLRKGLEINGCEFSGYKYIEDGNQFEIWTVRKSLKTFETYCRVEVI